jgi:hypothetical protein
MSLVISFVFPLSLEKSKSRFHAECFHSVGSRENAVFSKPNDDFLIVDAHFIAIDSKAARRSQTPEQNQQQATAAIETKLWIQHPSIVGRQNKRLIGRMTILVV